MNSFKIYYPIEHIAEDKYKVCKCDHKAGIFYKYLSNLCND